MQKTGCKIAACFCIKTREASLSCNPHPPSPVGLGLPDEPQRKRIAASLREIAIRMKGFIAMNESPVAPSARELPQCAHWG